MDGVTSLGLAANIIQFVEFGARLLSEATEVYHSATGLSKEYLELQDVAEDLAQMVNRLVVSKSSCTTSSEIEKIALLARAVAEELISVTRTLSAKDSRKKRWRSFLQALSTLWNREKIESLRARLENLRSQLSVHILASISVSQASLIADFNTLKDRYEELNCVREESVKQILDTLQDVKKESCMISQSCLEKTETTLKEAKLMLNTFNKEKTILESLLFDTMSHRYHAIADTHQRTFNWIFDPSEFPLSDPRSDIYFKEWLISGNGIYWISGKPGSGKSTLMKFISDADMTRQYLQQWAQSCRLVTASFYFWCAGTEMQRTQRGLLQQLLFEILRSCPDMIPILCAQRWTTGSLGDWSLRELEAAFRNLEKVGCKTKICFFVDGLDEYDGDQIELIRVLHTIAKAPNIKLCVSSRPWPCFEDAFGNSPDWKLYLHNLTVEDIARFARDKLEEIPGFAILRQERPLYSDLVREITRRAHGVFLWVFLVVRTLRDGLINGDSLTLLRQRLEETPSDLEPFFDRMIDSVDPVYRKQMAITFDVAVRAPQPMCMLTYWFLDESNHHVQQLSSGPDNSDICALEERMERRLNGCYKGLLEGFGVPGARKVHFIHRTILDYLRTRTVDRLFVHPNLRASTKAFKAFVVHARYCGVGKSRGFNSQDLCYFMTFARWAEQESTDFDWNLVKEMETFISARYANYHLRFIRKAVRYGFIPYLERCLPEDGRLLPQVSVPLLRAALEIQSENVHDMFGLQSSYDTLAWLMKHGADSNMPTSSGSTIFLEFLSENRAHARNHRSPWAYKQWEGMLSILLRHGARYNDVFADARLIEALPQIGFTKDGGISDLATAVLRSGKLLSDCLHRHLNIYSSFFKCGLNPNRRVSYINTTLWELWLWYILQWQIDHGCLEGVCVRAIRMFLSYDANPYQTVEFISDRVTGVSIWEVSDIVEVFFQQECRAEIAPVLEEAKTRWRPIHQYCLEDCRGRRRKSSKPDFDIAFATGYSASDGSTRMYLRK